MTINGLEKDREETVKAILDSIRYFGLLMGFVLIGFLLGKAINRIDKIESRMTLVETTNQKGTP